MSEVEPAILPSIAFFLEFLEALQLQLAHAGVDRRHFVEIGIAGTAVMIGPGMIGRDGVLSFRQVKTGGFAFVPWSGPVPAFASAPTSAAMAER